METAKVDIRKLQLLNDRINQVIDALHQVRLSVHALQQGVQTQPSLGAAFGTQAFGPTPYVNPFLGQAFNPFVQQPFQQAFGQGVNPMSPMNPLLGQGATPFGQGFGQTQGTITGGSPGLLHSGLPWLGGQGLSHTGTEQDLYNRPIWSDPFLAARVATTFPYANYPIPAVVTLY